MNTQDQTDEIIVELLANEFSMKEIAKEFGVSRYYVNNINLGIHGTIEGFRYPIRSVKASPKEKPSDMEVWYEDCYEVKL